MAWYRKAIDIKTIDQQVDVFADECQWDKMEDYLCSLKDQKLTEAAAEARDYYYGIAAFQSGKRSDALDRLTAAADTHPDSARIRFSLAQEILFTGDDTRAFEMFDTTLFPQVSSVHTMAACRYAYLWDRPEHGLRYMDPLFDAYLKLSSADDHFLYMRGLPFLGVTLGTAVAFHWCMGQLDAASGLLARFKGKLSDYDFADDELSIDALKSGDPQRLIEHLEARLADDQHPDSPDGYFTMRIAVLRSGMADDADKAQQTIAGVVLGPEDFPWLEHVRLLTKCKLASQAGDRVREDSLLSIFFGSQPLLFEPEHAVTYDLLSYQETLKPRARELARQRG